MVESLWTCVMRAHSTVRTHLVVVWFPALFSMAMGVVVALAAVVLILPLVPDLLTRPNLMPLASPEVLRALIPRMFLLLSLAIPMTIVATAGTLYLQSQAVKGQVVDTGHFFKGIRQLTWPLALGRALELVVYIALLAPIVFLVARRSLQLAGPERTMLLAPEEPLFKAFMELLPLLLLFGLVYIAIGVLLSMWPRVLALREQGIRSAFCSGAIFARRHFFGILLLLVAQWVLSTTVARLLGAVPIGDLVGFAVNYLLRLYLGITLMHYYHMQAPATEQQN